jgi:uncharacterized membrane protein
VHKRIGLYVVIALVSIILLLLLLREFKQYQINREANKVIENGGISEVRELTIGGISQYILIDGTDLNELTQHLSCQKRSFKENMIKWQTLI